MSSLLHDHWGLKDRYQPNSTNLGGCPLDSLGGIDLPMSDEPSGRGRAEWNTQEPKLDAGEDDCARAVGLDDLSGWRQHPVRVVDPERHDRVGVLLLAEALVGVCRIEEFSRRIEAEKARGLCVSGCPADRRQGPIAL